MIKRKLKFHKESNDLFYAKLRKEVYDYFDAKGVTIYANPAMCVKAVFFSSLFIATYLLIVFTHLAPAVKLGLCFLHGISIAGIGFNISHDCSHNAFFKKKAYNNLLRYSMDIVGSNSYTWNIKHNKAHHIYTNIDSFDEDITGSYLLRLSPHAPCHSINKYQFLYAWPLYCFIYFYIIWIYNFIQFRSENFGPFINIRHPQKEWVKLAVFKLFYVCYAIVVPIYWLDITIASFVIGYAIVYATTGFLLGVVFYLAHCVESSLAFPLPLQGKIDIGWASHQMRTTCNFAMNNKFITWFCGGLNFQIEHHLFPEICSVHYREISPIVQKVSKAYNIPYNIPYNNAGGIRKAIKSHYSALKVLGLPEKHLLCSQ